MCLLTAVKPVSPDVLHPAVFLVFQPYSSRRFSSFLPGIPFFIEMETSSLSLCSGYSTSFLSLALLCIAHTYRELAGLLGIIFQSSENSAWQWGANDKEKACLKCPRLDNFHYCLPSLTNTHFPKDFCKINRKYTSSIFSLVYCSSHRFLCVMHYSIFPGLT